MGLGVGVGAGVAVARTAWVACSVGEGMGDRGDGAAGAHPTTKVVTKIRRATGPTPYNLGLVRSLAFLVIVALTAACAQTPSGDAAPPRPSVTVPGGAVVVQPTASPSPLPTQATVLVPLVPVTRFDSFRDDVTIADLTTVLASSSSFAHVRDALPSAAVTEVADAEVLRVVRDSDAAIALVFPDQVQPWVKTLSIEGRFWWDPRLVETDYPLLVRVLGGTAPARARYWDLAAAQGIIYGRGVTWGMEKFSGGDPFAPFAKVAHVFQEADLAVSFMESALSDTNDGAYCHDCNVFVGDTSWVPAIAKAGFDALSLATNHTGDAREQGYLDTLRALRGEKIVPFGAGEDLAEALKPAVLEVKDIKVAFVGNNDVATSCCFAGEDSLGHVQFGHDDPEYTLLREQIAAAKKEADIVIVMSSLGWPSEYQDWALPQTIAAAHAMVEAGATAVLGGQPHWVGGVEAGDGTYIAYAMGNFIQDQMGRAVGFANDKTRQGTIHRLYFEGTRLVAVRILPTWLENWHQLRFSSPGEPQYSEVLEQVWRNSTFGELGAVQETARTR